MKLNSEEQGQNPTGIDLYVCMFLSTVLFLSYLDAYAYVVLPKQTQNIGNEN